MKKKAKRNPQDLTIRNLRAGKKTVSLLELRVKWLEDVVSWLMSSGIVNHTGTWGFPEYPIKTIEKKGKK